jgi:hypothetical protein
MIGIVFKGNRKVFDVILTIIREQKHKKHSYAKYVSTIQYLGDKKEITIFFGKGSFGKKLEQRQKEIAMRFVPEENMKYGIKFI